jgi:hypothetical protein
MIKTDRRTIYIEMLEEGTTCWRPVEAEYLGNELCRITGVAPNDEVWAFSVGDVVKCKMKTFQGDSKGLVVHEKIGQ